MTTMTTCASFHDLRAFAAGGTPAADPFAAGRRALPLHENGAIETGAIDLPAGNGTTEALEGDWFLLAAAGAVTIATDTAEVALGENDSCALPSGSVVTWRADAPATLIYMRYKDAAPGSQPLTAIDLAAPLNPSNAPLAELLVGATPSCRSNTQWRAADGWFNAGVWDSTPYFRKPMRYVHYELMYLLKGSVAFVDESGREGMFRQGDVFIVERDALCSWDSREDVAKVWVIWRKPA